jgi:branched-chain amino acid transport system substrate-binding protein
LAEAADVEGALSGSPINLDPNDAEVKLYNAVIKKYYPTITDDVNKVGGAYVPTLALARVLQTFTGDLTADSIDQAMKTAKDVKAPLAGGNTFTCGGTVFKSLPAYCSISAFITPLDAKAKPTSFQPVDTTKIFGPG